MKMYKVVIEGGLSGLEFMDLYNIVDNNRVTIKCKKNEIIPIEKIPADLFEQSLKCGCLFRSINAGWVQVIDNSTNEERAAEFIAKQQQELVKVNENANKSIEDFAKAYNRKDKNITTISPGSKIVDEGNNISTKEEIDSFESFNKLKVMDKTSFIGYTKNKLLLKEIIEKITNKTLQVKAVKKLKELEKS